MLSVGQLRELRKIVERSSQPKNDNLMEPAPSEGLGNVGNRKQIPDTRRLSSLPVEDKQQRSTKERSQRDSTTRNNEDQPQCSKSTDFRSAEPEELDLSNPRYLEMMELLSGKEQLRNGDEAFNAEDGITPAEIMLFHPVYSRFIRLLPMRDLLSFGQTSRSFFPVVQNEKKRERRHRFEWIYRKDFIRYLNLSYASRKSIKEEDVFSGVFRERYCYPKRVFAFYSPDIFQYDVRVLDHNGRTFNSKPDVILDNFMKRKRDGDLRVWHFRLFSVIRPENEKNAVPMNHSDYTRHELEKMYLWHSEDLVMVFVPSISGVRIRHHPLTLNMLLDIPQFDGSRNTANVFTYLDLIGQRYRPKLVILTVRELPSVAEENVMFSFPIVIFASRIFDLDAKRTEEWISFAGENVTVFQVILDVSDRRIDRDSKIHALHAQLGVTFPSSLQCWLFYFTELWPGGTSKEIPQSDVITLRNLFPGVPVFGGRTGKFMANQYLPILMSFPTQDARSLRIRLTPTVITVVCFGKS